LKAETIFKIFSKSLKDSITGKIWKFLLGSIGGLFGLLLFGKNFLNTSVTNSIIIGIVFLVCLFSIRLLLFLVRNSYNLYRESKYGEAIIILKEIFAEINFLRKKEKYDDDDLMKTLSYLCDNLKKLFDNKNMCKCSVSIKVPIKGAVTENTSVKNLCRDSEHHLIRDTEKYKEVDHTIIGNTAYRKILNNVLRKSKNGFYYFNNNITKTIDYDNTSKEVYPDGILPYKSEIVVPIIPSLSSVNNIYDLIGFLCVDCNEIDRFNEKYDTVLIEGVADGIYDILSKYIIKKNNLTRL